MGFLSWLRNLLEPRPTGSAKEAGRKEESSVLKDRPSKAGSPSVVRGPLTRPVEERGADAPVDRPAVDVRIPSDRRVDEHDQLVMGVDVGTSLSKVVVLVRGRRLAVRFDAPGGEDNVHLLPTALSVMDSGECRLGLHDGASEHFDDIKKPLIDGQFNKSAQLPLVAFMALLFRGVQKYIDESQGSMLSGRLDWLVNLGVPTESYGGGAGGVKDLVTAYSHSAEVAWGLAGRTRAERNVGPLTIDRCRQAMKAASKVEVRSDRISVFPEFVPQVASYVQSRQRQEGVHVLVDVGGGTLDVTVFQVLSRAQEDDEIPVWARTVEQLGTRYLVDHIGKASARDLSLSPFGHLPSDMDIARAVGLPLAGLKEAVKPFRQQVVSAVGETIRDAGKEFSLQWPGRMFLSGGGAFVNLYKDIAEEFQQKEWKFGVRWVHMPRPDDLEAAIADSSWHRLAVAYGLSWDPFDIKDIMPPEDIEPVPPDYWKPPDGPPPWIGTW